MQGGKEAGNNTNKIFAEICAAVWWLQNEDRELGGRNLQGIWKKRDQNEGESIARAGLPNTLESIFFSPLESCDEFGNGVVSLLGCWGGGKVLKGAKWKASESSAEQWCKLLLFSKLFTSSLWFQHQQWPPCAAFTPPSLSLSLSLSAPSILSPFSFMLSPPSSPPAFASLLPSTSPHIALIYYLAIHPARSQKSSLCIYLHDVGKKHRIGSTWEVSVRSLDHYH